MIQSCGLIVENPRHKFIIVVKEIVRHPKLIDHLTLFVAALGWIYTADVQRESKLWLKSNLTQVPRLNFRHE